MLSEKRKKRRAVSDKATPKNIQQRKSYRNSVSASRAKLQIGELLWFLYLEPSLSQQQKSRCWQIFELKLREYLDVKYSGVLV